MEQMGRARWAASQKGASCLARGKSAAKKSGYIIAGQRGKSVITAEMR